METTLPKKEIPPYQRLAPSRSSLLPNAFASPWALFLAVVPSEILLLSLNAQSVWLAWGEMNSWQHNQSLILGGILVLFNLLAIFRVATGYRRSVSFAECGALFIGHVAYLWTVIAWLNSILPASVPGWIVQPERLLFYQFTLATPAMAYALLRVSCYHPRKTSFAQDLLLSLVVMLVSVGVPFLLAFSGSVFFGSMEHHTFVRYFTAVLFIVCTTLCLGALLRFSTNLFQVLQNQGAWGATTLAALTGLVMPVAGLLLNIAIPFPYDLQSDRVYLLTVLNGLLLVLPSFKNHAGLNKIVWLTKCASFPFSVYFLILFLPFLPLSIPAMLAMGSGFLILAPVALFMVHGNFVLEGWQTEKDRRNWLSPTLQMLTAFAIIPAVYLGLCYADRIALHRGLDYVYRQEYNPVSKTSGLSSKSIGRAVEHLRDFKAGLGLPFLSEAYSKIVFDSLVLPDDKIANLYRLYMGKPLPEFRQDAVAGIAGNRRNRSWARTTREAPPTTAVVSQANVSLIESGDTTRARLDIEVTNPTSLQAEYSEKLVLPAGVVISGYALYIGDQRVAGQLFEKKTALWVYEKIVTVTRRDPGLLAYSGKNQVDARIFPVEANSQRRAEIEFCYPSGNAPVVRLGEREIILPVDPMKSSQSLSAASADGTSLVLSAKSDVQKKAFIRKPVVHMLVDASAQGLVAPDELQKATKTLLAWLPAETRVEVTAVNFANQKIALPHAGTLGGLAQSTSPIQIPHSGGFWPQRALREILLRQDSPEEFPLFVVLTNRWEDRWKEENFILEDQLLPDVNGFVVLSKAESKFVLWTGTSHPLVPGDLAQSAVVVLKTGRTTRAVRAGAENPVQFLDEKGPINCYDSASKTFLPLDDVASLAANDKYAQALSQIVLEEKIFEKPEQEIEVIREIASIAKNSGILTPSVAYIVVENSAQWKMLAEKEKQKVRNGKELEIEEPQVTPEPETWTLLAIAFIFICLRQTKWRRRLTA